MSAQSKKYNVERTGELLKQMESSLQVIESLRELVKVTQFELEEQMDAYWKEYMCPLLSKAGKGLSEEEMDEAKSQFAEMTEFRDRTLAIAKRRV